MAAAALFLIGSMAPGVSLFAVTPPKSKSKKKPVKPKLVRTAIKKKPRTLTVRKIAAPAVSTAVREAEIQRVEQRLEDDSSAFENSGALVPFLSLLSRARTSSVHILQFGDSHTASDDLVNAMRTELQAHYGAGGAGFTLAGQLRGYRRFDVALGSTAGWTPEGTTKNPGDGREGLSGISITAQSAGQSVTLRTSGDLLEVHYLQQPEGGDFEFSVDGRPVEVVSTRGEFNDGIYSYQPTPGEHEYRLRTLSADPVRLFGWVSDAQRGVTFETLGINGAQASMILHWDNTILQQEVASRQPALIVLEYGTNEANSMSWTAEQYKADLENVLLRLRSAAPLASILMIGPPDCGKLRPLTHLDEVIAIERRVARESGVAFWDWRAHMGGPRAVVQWVRASLGQPDYVHLTGSGYRLIGKAIAEELEAAHALYLSALANQAKVKSGPIYDATK
jgi:lysophospholipase L1-like esterase